MAAHSLFSTWLEPTGSANREYELDTTTFWRLIDAARKRAGADTYARADRLAELLQNLPASELRQFQRCYDEQLRRASTWGLRGAASVINGGCTEEGFRYFRDWLISEGLLTFERALSAPDSMADLPRIREAELELFGYIAPALYEEKTEAVLRRDGSAESMPPRGASWAKADLPRLLPRLCAKYRTCGQTPKLRLVVP